MAKNNKTSAAASAAEQAAQQTAPVSKKTGSKTSANSTKKTEVAVLQLSDLEKLANANAITGLDPNHTEDLLHLLDKRFYDDKAAAKKYNIPQDTVDKINEITAIGLVAVLTNEITIAHTPFAIAMRRTQLEAIQEAALALGVTIDTKALPAPNSDGIIELPSTAITVSKEVQKKVEEERAAAEKKVITDPTKVENDTQLKETLLNILVKGNGSENFYDKVVTAINFYESYLSIQANKSENKEEQQAALKQKTRAEFLTEIAHLLGKCTFTVGGMAKFMFEQTERTKSPVVAFCTLRNASLNKKTGMPQVEDQLVADIVKVLVRWYADSEIATTNQIIAGFERDIELLKKDAKKHAKGIEDGNKKIESAKKRIQEIEAVVSYANMPGRETVDTFIDNYTNNKTEGFKLARMIGSKIIQNYYHDIDIKSVTQDSLVHNLQQYVGVITNMFLPPLNQITDYSEANIGDLKVAQPTEETPTEEEPKNE